MNVHIDGVAKSFGSFRALEHIDLEIASGELVALLGPSGSGKTTLLRMVAGLELPDDGAGSIRFDGQDVTRDAVRSRGVGFVFQHYALFRNMSVRDNIAFGLTVKPRRERPSRSEIDRRVEELLALVQLEGLGKRRPHQLSGGQRQRVALARALAVRPRILLLDEPFGALDAKVRQELRRWLRLLHEEVSVTTLFVTHDQEEALEVADRVVLMDRGRIQQVGTPDDVFHQPASEFVASFLGQVNRFDGRAEKDRLHFAGAQFRAGAGPLGPVHVFVRTHEFDVLRRAESSKGLPGRLVRVHSAGPLARLEFALDSGETALVDLAHDRYGSLAPILGERLQLVPQNWRVFGAPHQAEVDGVQRRATAS